MQAATHIDIRRAGPRDAPAIAQVLHDSFLEFKALYTAGAFSATALSPEQVLARICEGPVWVATGESSVLGTVAAILKDDESAYMRGMAVLPSARGSRVGAALLQHAEAWAAGAGCTRLFLSTTAFLSSAIRLYERAGFIRIDEGPHELFGTPLFVMKKNISRRPSG
jgi:N-acetylglutamate synthase-like GNAT family acetyltransferase